MIVSLHEVTKQFGNNVILDGISLTIAKGDCMIVRGSNGSGKSTLLRVVAGLVPINSGRRITNPPKLLISYAPDHLPKLRMTSTQYLTHIGKLSSMPKAEIPDKIEELHALFQLPQTSMKMNQYSKGMLQKVNLMQATIRTPDLLVLDEPFSGLDSDSSDHLILALNRLKVGGVSILAAVHEPLLSNQLDSVTLMLDNGKLLEQRGMEQYDSYEFYELKCVIPGKLVEHMSRLFANLGDIRCSNNITLLKFSRLELRSVLLLLMEHNIEIISLVRKESP